MLSQQSYGQAHLPNFETPHDWPRDFDFRAKYAEQQELISTPEQKLPEADQQETARHE